MKFVVSCGHQWLPQAPLDASQTVITRWSLYVSLRVSLCGLACVSVSLRVFAKPQLLFEWCFINVFVCLRVFVHLCVLLCVCASMCASVCLCIYVCFCVFVHLCVLLCVCASMCASVCLCGFFYIFTMFYIFTRL